ncbi:MAG: alpha/beta hydrolase [Gammaproteobacteria bacterium]
MAGVSRFLTFNAYRRDIEAARARIATGSRVVETPLGPVEYADVGRGPPVLMSHGAGGGFDQSVEVGRLLIDEGFRLIAPSRFGYLRTPLPADASPSAQADAHACLLDALGLDRVAVVGASLGAPSVVQLCVRHPERCSSMVLVVPVLYSPQGAARFLRRSLAMVRRMPHMALSSDFLFWLATHVGGSVILESLIGVPRDELRNAPRAERERIRHMLNLALPMSARATGLKNDVSTDLPRDELERIDTPALIVGVATDLYGTLDIARYTSEQISGARLLSYPNGGHLWVGYHENMLGEIAAFMKSNQGGRQN